MTWNGAMMTLSLEGLRISLGMGAEGLCIDYLAIR